jgi:hypothetical protein
MKIRHCPHTPGGNGYAGGDLRRRIGFTLIELLLILGVLGILAALTIASFASLIGHGQAEALSVTVRNVREILEIKAITPDVAVSPEGHPLTIESRWFQGNRMPYHTWTQRPMVIQIFAGPVPQVYPEVKTFNPKDPVAVNAWYNTSNGAFCVLVGDEGNAADQIEAFNIVNICDITTLDQITR